MYYIIYIYKYIYREFYPCKASETWHQIKLEKYYRPDNEMWTKCANEAKKILFECLYLPPTNKFNKTISL